MDKNILIKLKEYEGSCTVRELMPAVPDFSEDTLCSYLVHMRKKLKRKEGSWINFDGARPTMTSRIWMDVGVYCKLMR